MLTQGADYAGPHRSSQALSPGLARRCKMHYYYFGDLDHHQNLCWPPPSSRRGPFHLYSPLIDFLDECNMGLLLGLSSYLFDLHELPIGAILTTDTKPLVIRPLPPA